jgi:hypothetical protein
MLNHPFVQEQARALAKRLATDMEPAAKLQHLYRDIYARMPDADEMRIGLQFVEQSGRLKSGAGSLSPWECLAQALLVANEFVFVD